MLTPTKWLRYHDYMIIDCISDLHGHYPKLEGGDLLIVAGDLTARDTVQEYMWFLQWADTQKYKKVIFIAGNHDNHLIKELPFLDKNPITQVQYLSDSGTEFEDLKIWGSPWTLRFKGQNPKAMAFSTNSETELAEKWALIPEDTDILVTHSPPQGILDKTVQGKHVGSRSLIEHVSEMAFPPKLWVWGHIHESYGKDFMGRHPNMCVNASHVNEHYDPVNAPIRIEL